MTSHTYIWFDLGFTAILTPADDHVLVEVYRHTGRFDIDSGPPFYESEMDPNESVSHLDEAKMFCEGTICWLGCTNWRFDQDDQMVHLCDPEAVIDMAGMMLRVRESAKALIHSPTT